MPFSSSSLASKATKDDSMAMGKHEHLQRASSWDSCDSDRSSGAEELALCLPRSQSAQKKICRRSILEDSSSSDEASEQLYWGMQHGSSSKQKEKRSTLRRDKNDTDSDNGSVNTVELVRRLKASKPNSPQPLPRLELPCKETVDIDKHRRNEHEETFNSTTGKDGSCEARMSTMDNDNSSSLQTKSRSTSRMMSPPTRNIPDLDVESPALCLQIYSDDDDDDDDDSKNSVDTIELTQRLQSSFQQQVKETRTLNYRKEKSVTKSHRPSATLSATHRSENYNDGESEINFVLPPQSDSSSDSEGEVEEEIGKCPSIGAPEYPTCMVSITQLRDTTASEKSTQPAKSHRSANIKTGNHSTTNMSERISSAEESAKASHARLPTASLSSKAQQTLKRTQDKLLSQSAVHFHRSETIVENPYAATLKFPAVHQKQSPCATTATHPMEAASPSPTRYKVNEQSTARQDIQGSFTVARTSADRSSDVERKELTKEELYEVAFASPMSRRASVQTQPIASIFGGQSPPPQQSSGHDLFEAAFGADKRPCGQKNESASSVVNLCFDSEGEDVQDFAPKSAANVRHGLRCPSKSPRFNIVARAFTKAKPPSQTDTAVDSESDIENFSDDEDYRPRRRKVRRVTEDHSLRINQRCSTLPSCYDMFKADRTATPQKSVARNSGQLNTRSGEKLARPWPTNTRCRLRDATSSNPVFAASVRPRRPAEPSKEAQLEKADSNVWFKRSCSSSADKSTSQTHRNDLRGGSGVGAGSFSFSERGSTEAIDDANENILESERSASGVSRSKKGTRRKRQRGNSNRNQAKNGRGKRSRGGASQKPGGRRTARGGNHNGAWGSTRSELKPVPLSTREDPAFRNVGGAEISF